MHRRDGRPSFLGLLKAVGSMEQIGFPAAGPGGFLEETDYGNTVFACWLLQTCLDKKHSNYWGTGSHSLCGQKPLVWFMKRGCFFKALYMKTPAVQTEQTSYTWFRFADIGLSFLGYEKFSIWRKNKVCVNNRLTHVKQLREM
ncbi:hypothetical protein FKM82_013689 [Ascaphus truei]